MKVSRLLKKEARLTKEELKGFKKGDLITGNDVNPEELKRWTGEGCREKAMEELKKFNSSYYIGEQLADVTEYAVETYEANEDGDFLEGSDYDFAEPVTQVYFFETSDHKEVVFTDGLTAKFYGTGKSGFFEGVDLYKSDAVKKVKAALKKLQKSGELEEFNNMHSSDTQPARNLFSWENEPEAELTLIFEYK